MDSIPCGEVAAAVPDEIPEVRTCGMCGSGLSSSGDRVFSVMGGLVSFRISPRVGTLFLRGGVASWSRRKLSSRFCLFLGVAEGGLTDVDSLLRAGEISGVLSPSSSTASLFPILHLLPSSIPLHFTSGGEGVKGSNSPSLAILSRFTNDKLSDFRLEGLDKLGEGLCGDTGEVLNVRPGDSDRVRDESCSTTCGDITSFLIPFHSEQPALGAMPAIPA